MFNRNIMLASILALTATASIAAEPLFLPANSLQNNAVSASAVASPFAGDRKVVSSHAGLRLNPAAASATELNLDLPDGKQLTARRVNRYTTSSGSTVWIGKHVMANGSLAADAVTAAGEETILVERQGRITGTMRSGGKLYRIRSAADGSHVLAEVDASRFPPDHSVRDYQSLVAQSKPINAPAKAVGSGPAEFAQFDQQARAAAVSSDNTGFALATPSVIRVLVNYTSAAKTAAGDIDALIDLSIAETNQGYVNSNVNARLELAYKAPVTYTQSGIQATDRDRYAATNDGYMDEIHTQRTTYAADVGILIVNDGDESCGIAKAIGATASSAFAAVHWDCSTGNLSFGHEIGHLYGARHNPENDGTTTPYAYGHGYWAPNSAWRTVMAYPCSAKTCPRLNYWSSPLLTYTDGQKMGTSANSDNARVLNERAAVLAAFLGAPATGVSVTNTADYAIPDNNTTGVSSPISVTTAGNAGTVTVDVNIVHTYIGDLVVDLIAPDGVVYNLQNRAGGSADNIVQSYSVNVGAKSRVGTWKLRASDRASGDTGYINSWTFKSL
jgi:hypothetical protein